MEPGKQLGERPHLLLAEDGAEPAVDVVDMTGCRPQIVSSGARGNEILES